MIKRVFLLLVLLGVFFGCVTVTAQDFVCSFSLSDVSVKKDRLFEVVLSVQSSEKIAAFVGEISFDPDMMEYRKATLSDEGSVISVNANEKDKITFAFLCEDGKTCTSETSVVTFSFKAVTEGESTLSLNVRDVVTPECGDVSVTRAKDACVTVTNSEGSGKSENNKDSQNSEGNNGDSVTDVTTEFTEDMADALTIVSGNSVNLLLIVCVGVSVVTALVIVAYVFYKLGVRKQKEISIKDMKDGENFEEKT